MNPSIQDMIELPNIVSLLVQNILRTVVDYGTPPPPLLAPAAELASSSVKMSIKRRFDEVGYLQLFLQGIHSLSCLAKCGNI